MQAITFTALPHSLYAQLSILTSCASRLFMVIAARRSIVILGLADERTLGGMTFLCRIAGVEGRGCHWLLWVASCPLSFVWPTRLPDWSAVYRCGAGLSFAG